MGRLLLALLLIVGQAACTKNYFPAQQDGASPSPSPTPVVPVQHTIEYRVLGTAGRASIVYGSAIEGSTATDSFLPWVSSFKTTASSLFVFVTATSEADGRVTAQIFVDGQLFREATNGDTAGVQATASGEVQF